MAVKLLYTWMALYNVVTCLKKSGYKLMATLA